MVRLEYWNWIPELFWYFSSLTFILFFFLFVFHINWYQSKLRFLIAVCIMRFTVSCSAILILHPIETPEDGRNQEKVGGKQCLWFICGCSKLPTQSFMRGGWGVGDWCTFATLVAHNCLLFPIHWGYHCCFLILITTKWSPSPTCRHVNRSCCSFDYEEGARVGQSFRLLPSLPSSVTLLSLSVIVTLHWSSISFPTCHWP